MTVMMVDEPLRESVVRVNYFSLVFTRGRHVRWEWVVGWFVYFSPFRNFSVYCLFIFLFFVFFITVVVHSVFFFSQEGEGRSFALFPYLKMSRLRYEIFLPRVWKITSFCLVLLVYVPLVCRLSCLSFPGVYLILKLATHVSNVFPQKCN